MARGSVERSEKREGGEGDEKGNLQQLRLVLRCDGSPALRQKAGRPAGDQTCTGLSGTEHGASAHPWLALQRCSFFWKKMDTSDSCPIAGRLARDLGQASERPQWCRAQHVCSMLAVFFVASDVLEKGTVRPVVKNR